jgi:hypothetical protein
MLTRKSCIFICAVLTVILFIPFFTQAEFLLDRQVFVRGEHAVFIFSSEEEYVFFDVSGLLNIKIPTINGTARYEFNTSLLRSGDYEVRATPFPNQGKETAAQTTVNPITIAPLPNPQRYPVWHWGGVSSDQLPYWIERGFNGFRSHSIRAPFTGKAESNAQIVALLEEGARHGADVGLYFHPLLWTGWKKQKDAHCLAPRDRRDPMKIYPLEPKVMAFAKETVRSWMEPLSGFPSLRHALLSSEYTTPFCVNDAALTAASKAGIDLQQALLEEIVLARWGRTRGAHLSDSLRPRNGLVEDNNRLYRLLNWWWRGGNGIAPLNAMMADEIRAKRKDILVWHDPYRQAPVYGTHDGLDAISTWTYGHPDIKRLCYTRALQAAAKKQNLKVMQTITLFVYSHFMMPQEKLPETFLDKPSGEPFFTNGPDYTREAMWLAFSQRPDILSFYYAGKLNPNRTDVPLVNASPETFDAIGEINRTLIGPYGPAILQGQPAKARAAVLMSGAAIWFRENPRWAGNPNESILPFCTLLMMNHVPFDVVLDEDIIDGKLADYDLLVIPYGDALTANMHRQIKKFAGSGKTIVADTTLEAPIPGAHIMDFDFSFLDRVNGKALKQGNAMTADEYQEKMEDYADQLKAKLQGLSAPFRCDSKKVLINEVRSGDVRYVFVVNDKKTYGPRFGRWKLHQELGVEQGAKVEIAVLGRPAIYDSLALEPVGYQLSGGFAGIKVTLPPAQGKLFAVLPRAVGGVQVSCPETMKRGYQNDIRLTVTDISNSQIQGAVPLQISLYDADGKETEYSQFATTTYSKNNGWSCIFKVKFALNDKSGFWTLQVKELLGGKITKKLFYID